MSRRSDRFLESPPETILRFLITERLLHWAIAIPFLGCLLSALVLVVVYNHNPTGSHRYIFAWMHRACGAGLLLCPSLVLLGSGRGLRMHAYNIRQAWGWTLDDVKWLGLMGVAVLSKRVVLPDQGKFNAAEKLNFMMVMVYSPILITTGFLIWFPELTVIDPLGPWLVHFSLAATAAPLLIGHMFMATINPDTRVGLSGMISGFVSREWAAHHYAHWFRERFPELAQEVAAACPGDFGAAAVNEPAMGFYEPEGLVPPTPAETGPVEQALFAGEPPAAPLLAEPIAETALPPTDPVEAEAHVSSPAHQRPPLEWSVGRVPNIVRPADSPPGDDSEMDLLYRSGVLARAVAVTIATAHVRRAAGEVCDRIALRASGEQPPVPVDYAEEDRSDFLTAAS